MRNTGFKDLPKRLLSAFVSIGILFALIYFAKTPLFKIVIVVLIVSLCACGLVEFVWLAEKKGADLKKAPLVISGAAFCLCFYFWQELALLPLLAFFILFFFLFILHFNRIKNAIFSVAASIFSLLYIALPLGLVFPLLYFYKEDGRLWLFYLLAVTKGSDIGGYFGGLLFGRKKIAPRLSPKKTVAGTVCGFLLAIFISYVFLQLSRSAFAGGFSLSGLQEAVLLALLLSAGAQLGDLAESLLKRDAGVKNSGRLPGFGGVLDMLDSLFFNLPILFFYLEVTR